MKTKEDLKDQRYEDAGRPMKLLRVGAHYYKFVQLEEEFWGEEHDTNK